MAEMDVEALKQQAEVGTEMVREAVELLRPHLADWQIAQVMRIVVPFQTQKQAHLAALERIPELERERAEYAGKLIEQYVALERAERVEAAARAHRTAWKRSGREASLEEIRATADALDAILGLAPTPEGNEAERPAQSFQWTGTSGFANATKKPAPASGDEGKG